MNAPNYQLSYSKSGDTDEEIKQLYINYMQFMLDCARNEKLMEEVKTSNEKRIHYLNDLVGMKIPEGTTVLFNFEDNKMPVVYIKTDSGEIMINEGMDTLKIVEKVKNGDVDKESMALTSAEEVDVEIKGHLEASQMVIELPFLDPSRDLMLFELKYEDKEIVFTTCCL